MAYVFTYIMQLGRKRRSRCCRSYSALCYYPAVSLLQGYSRGIIVPITKRAPDTAVWAILKDAESYTDKSKTEPNYS